MRDYSQQCVLSWDGGNRGLKTVLIPRTRYLLAAFSVSPGGVDQRYVHVLTTTASDRSSIPT